MIKQIELKILPSKLYDEEYILKQQNMLLKGINGKINDRILIKRSIDARGNRPLYVLRFHIYIDEVYQKPPSIIKNFINVSDCQPIIIIGSGPAGYFAALKCLECGFKPIVLERGKDVRERRKDLRNIQQFGLVDEDSNYCFGEGGAGTYSDGKLYTRSHKRGSIENILRLLVEHGATEEIMFDAHPHIGSNKLPGIIANIRNSIEKYGGEVHFNHRVTDFTVINQRITHVFCGDKSFAADHIILATGHSARDIYQLLLSKNVKVEAKPFALGLRIEHKQSFIDQMQYHQPAREENLPASSYSVVSQVDGKGVFSFCMCPGGLVVPAATAPGEIVVNGMSLSRRDSPYANSGIVTSIELDELEKHGYVGSAASLNFQQEMEKKMFAASDGSQKAPAQRVADFVHGILSDQLNPTSYIPGLVSAPLHDILPSFLYQRLKNGLLEINKKIKGYVTNEANIIGVESRTSSPVRIPRDPVSCSHPDIENLYPCGEGAGYAGGIISAAMDGQNVVQSIFSQRSKE
jgi:uncharacterized FAD-dependent dehydrogenase